MNTPPTSSSRAFEIDALRGLMLVLMTSTHLPTRFSGPFGQPFGFVSAAEGFVLLSGFMAGMVYMQRHQRHGEAEMKSAFLKRVAKIYLLQVVMLVFLFGLIALIGAARREPAIVNLLSFYWEQPLTAFVNGLVLMYNPPLLDILPMYVLFMLVSAPLMLHGLRNGWGLILVLSIAFWLAAQFGAGERVYDWLVAATKVQQLPPVRQTGSFSIIAWQFLWVLGLWLGATRVATADTDLAAAPRRFPRWMVRVAWAIAIVCFLWRHGVGQTPFPGDATLNLLFSKWRLGPLRIINLLALLLLVMHYAPVLRRIPRIRFLETMGAASLAVFIAHLVLALLALAFLGAADPKRPLWIDIALFVGSYAVLYAVAWFSLQTGKRGAKARQKLGQWGRAALTRG